MRIILGLGVLGHDIMQKYRLKGPAVLMKGSPAFSRQKPLVLNLPEPDRNHVGERDAV